MSNDINQTGWNKRKADYTKVHGDSSEAFAALLASLNLQNGMTVADIMGGYGDVSKQILNYCTQKGLSIKLFLSDGFLEQIKRSREYLAEYGDSVERKVEDARSLAFRDASLDRVVVKMGLHEVRKADQPLVARELYRSLKAGGEAFIWESVGQNDYLAYFWRGVVRKKDELAGFVGLVENRYFPSESEMTETFKAVGFRAVERVYCGDFQYVTKNLICDFNGDQNKLDSWNEFLRQRLPEDVKKAINFIDEGYSISMTLAKVILRAKK